jgi:chemotaxis protein histidine kinase CheA
MTDQIKSAESVAIEKFVKPAEVDVLNISGFDAITIRSDVSYERAGLALRTVRDRRKALAAYLKEQPSGEAGPGQGLCFYARKAWESANSLFNRFDLQFKQWDESITGEMSKYRAEVERKAREEAEAKAAEERQRLEAEAAKQRAEAEAERQKAEEERQKRLAVEQAAAKSKSEMEAAKRRAEEERLRIKAEIKRQKEEAEAKEREAQNVIAVVEREVPKVEGMSVRKSWKAEVVDFAALVREVAAGRAPLTCLEASESGCNKIAMAFGGVNPPAGLRFVSVEISTTRRTK